MVKAIVAIRFFIAMAKARSPAAPLDHKVVFFGRLRLAADLYSTKV